MGRQGPGHASLSRRPSSLGRCPRPGERPASARTARNTRHPPSLPLQFLNPTALRGLLVWRMLPASERSPQPCHLLLSLLVPLLSDAAADAALACLGVAKWLQSHTEVAQVENVQVANLQRAYCTVYRTAKRQAALASGSLLLRCQPSCGSWLCSSCSGHWHRGPRGGARRCCAPVRSLVGCHPEAILGAEREASPQRQRLHLLGRQAEGEALIDPAGWAEGCQHRVSVGLPLIR